MRRVCVPSLGMHFLCRHNPSHSLCLFSPLPSPLLSLFVSFSLSITLFALPSSSFLRLGFSPQLRFVTAACTWRLVSNVTVAHSRKYRNKIRNFVFCVYVSILCMHFEYLLFVTTSCILCKRPRCKLLKFQASSCILERDVYLGTLNLLLLSVSGN